MLLWSVYLHKCDVVACCCVWLQRQGLSTGLASAVSSSKTATLTRSWKATQTRTVRKAKHTWLDNQHAAVCVPSKAWLLTRPARSVSTSFQVTARSGGHTRSLPRAARRLCGRRLRRQTSWRTACLPPLHMWRPGIQCCFPARTLQAGQAGLHAASLLWLIANGSGGHVAGHMLEMFHMSFSMCSSAPGHMSDLLLHMVGRVFRWLHKRALHLQVRWHKPHSYDSQGS